MTDTPNFAAWSNENLAKYALDQYLQNIALMEANEALRLQIKDAADQHRVNLREAMNLLREKA
jgi:hypothetical protein